MVATVFQFKTKFHSLILDVSAQLSNLTTGNGVTCKKETAQFSGSKAQANKKNSSRNGQAFKVKVQSANS